jgi:hypothetical protein
VSFWSCCIADYRHSKITLNTRCEGKKKEEREEERSV